MERRPSSGDALAAAASPLPPSHAHHPPFLPFESPLLPPAQGSSGPLPNQIYPLDGCWGTNSSRGREQLHATPVTGPLVRSTNTEPQSDHVAAPVAEVIVVDDDEDDALSFSAERARQASFGAQDINGVYTNNRRYSNSDGSNSSNSKPSSSKHSRSSSRASRRPLERPPPDQCIASASVATAPQDREATASKEVDAGPPDDAKAISGAHSKSLWLHGRQRSEQIEKHLSDLRTKFAIGKVSMRNAVFPSVSAVTVFMRAVASNPRVTSITLNVPEMPEDQFAAVCDGLRSCWNLNHVDCNTIGNKPLPPEALHQLLRQVRTLPDLRELNISGNEFAAPSGPPTAQTRGGGPPRPLSSLTDGIQLLKDLVLGGVLCLLARECGLRQVRSFLLWLLNRCHCLRLRQLDLGASSKLLTTLVPGETFDEELLRRVSRLSRSTWRMGKVIGDYVPSFKGALFTCRDFSCRRLLSVDASPIDLWTPHMTHTFWLYCLLDAMVAASPPAAEGALKDATHQAADTPPLIPGGLSRLPLIRVWGVPTDHTISTPAHAANFRYGILVARLGDRCLVRWVPVANFLAAVEEDMLACEAACSRVAAEHSQRSLRETAPAQRISEAPLNNHLEHKRAGEALAPLQASLATAASGGPPKQPHLQQRVPAGGRTSARLACSEAAFGSSGAHADSLTSTFGAYDACVDAARVEPAVFAFAAWRKQQRQHNKYFKPGQWVEVINAKKEDKKFFYSSIGVVQQTIMGPDGTECAYRVEYLGLPPRSFTRLTLGGSPAPSDVAAVLRSTVRVAIVPADKVRPLVFLLPNDRWTVEELHARYGASNCVVLSDAYGVDMKCPAYGGQVVYALSVASQSSTTDSSSSDSNTSCGNNGSSSSSSSQSDSIGVSQNMVTLAVLPKCRWHIQLNCQHLEFSAKQLLHPRQLFCRFGMEGPVIEGGSADLFEPLGVTSTPPSLGPPPAYASCPESVSPAPAAAASAAASCTAGEAAPVSARVAGCTDSRPQREISAGSSPGEPGPPPVQGGGASPKARKRLPTASVPPGVCAVPSQTADDPGPPSVPSRKKQSKPPLPGPKAGVSANDSQGRPCQRRAPPEASVVVELSDDEAGEVSSQRPQAEVGKTSKGNVAGDKLPKGSSHMEGLSHVHGSREEVEEAPVDTGGLDAAMWPTVLTCARCRMPMNPPFACSAGVIELRAPAGSHARNAGEQPREGACAGEEGFTAGVRRRFRAYVRRLNAERSQEERRRLDRLLEGLQLPLPSNSDPGGSSATSAHRKPRSSQNGGRYSGSGSGQKTVGEQDAFERCLQAVGASAVPVAAATGPNAVSGSSSSSSALPKNAKPAAALRQTATARTPIQAPRPSDAGEARRANCSREAHADATEGDAGSRACFCTCNDCSCCLKRSRLCRPNDPVAAGASLDLPQGPLPLCESERDNELSPQEWDLVRKAVRILCDRGVMGLVAYDRVSSGQNLRLLALPGTCPPEDSAATGAQQMTQATVSESLEDGDELRELRRVLEQRAECPYWSVTQPRKKDSFTGREVAATRQSSSLLYAGDGLLCGRCLEDGWISEMTLPGLLDRYRSDHTDSTCNAPACTALSGRCGCRGVGKRRRTSTAKPQVFGWSRNRAFHGISALAQACNMSQEDAEDTYSDYALMQVESLQRSARPAC
ncbi:hypothetical protein Emed_005573 [Eimeria media]